MRKKKIGKNLGTPGKQTKRNETQHNEEMIAKMHGANFDTHFAHRPSRIFV